MILQFEFSHFSNRFKHLVLCFCAKIWEIVLDKAKLQADLTYHGVIMLPMCESLFVHRKTGALLLQTLKNWMRMWSMRSESLNLTLRMKTRVNPSRQVVNSHALRLDRICSGLQPVVVLICSVLTTVLSFIV